MPGVIGGSRHYVGPGLGADTGWRCVRCGAVNAGPLSQGCQLCGSGAPGTHEEPEPTPRPVVAQPPLPNQRQGDVGDYWADQHPTATIAEAYRAGYLDGVRAAKAAMRAQTMQAPPVTADVEALAPQGKPARTIVAALARFRDQVLVEQPEEVASGEWCSPEEVTVLIDSIRKTYEV